MGAVDLTDVEWQLVIAALECRIDAAREEAADKFELAIADLTQALVSRIRHEIGPEKPLSIAPE